MPRANGSRTKAEMAKHRKEYQSRPDVMKKRALMNKARRMMIKEGKTYVGDKRDVGHVKPLRDGGESKLSNLEMQSRKKNRGWKRET